MKQKVFSLPIFLNGELYNLYTYKLFNLKELLSYFSYKQNLVIVEYNGKISSTKYWTLTKLTSLDKLETITIVGGG
jgi:thiamine biosynthesis protein ThiS